MNCDTLSNDACKYNVSTKILIVQLAARLGWVVQITCFLHYHTKGNRSIGNCHSHHPCTKVGRQDKCMINYKILYRVLLAIKPFHTWSPAPKTFGKSTTCTSSSVTSWCCFKRIHWVIASITLCGLTLIRTSWYSEWWRPVMKLMMKYCDTFYSAITYYMAFFYSS